jgi:hypothetical protein
MSASKARSGRLNMRCPDDLLDWAKDYAKLKNTTVTQLVIDHFTELRETVNGNNGMAARRHSTPRVQARP